jgi:hypothetical protein
MYRFKLSDGMEARIYFSHKGGKKGVDFNPGKSPRVTECSIISYDNKVLGRGTASPLKTVLEEIPECITEEFAYKIYGKRLKKIVRKDDKTYAVLKGDSFCREKGRKESLKKAIVHIPKEDRFNAWEAIGETFCR